MEKKIGLKHRIINYLNHGIWSISLENKPKKIAFVIKQLRVVVIAWRGFNEDKCLEKASSLTFYSLLSIVPIFAMLFGVAKGFGFEEKMQSYMYESFKDKKDILDQVFEFTHRMLENTEGGIIAGAGLVLLLWSVMKLLSSIEGSLNDIWDISESRSTIRKISDYFSIMFLAPILLLVSISATTLISAYMHDFQQQYQWLNDFGWLITIVLKIMPWSLVWFAFAFIYMLMPNTKVFFRSAIIAGVISGIIFQVVQFIYIEFQVGVANQNAIYGSFAALPLFLAWLQTSWIIVLLGAEISFASQNANSYEFELESKSISHWFRIKLSVYIIHYVAERFDNEESPLTASEIANKIGLPIRVVSAIIADLIESGLLIVVTRKETKENAVHIATPLSKLSIYKIIEKLNSKGTNNLGDNTTKAYNEISNTIDSLYNSMCLNEENVLIREIKLKTQA